MISWRLALQSCNNDTIMLFSCNLALTEATQRPELDNRPADGNITHQCWPVNQAMRSVRLRDINVASASIGQSH